MICDARDVPLDDFEEDILAELRAAAQQLQGGTVSVERPADTKLPALRTGHGWIRPAAGIAAAVALGITSFALFDHHQGSASAAPALPRPLAFSHGSASAAVALLNQAAAAQEAVVVSGGPVTYAKTQNYALQITVSGHRSTTVVGTTIRQVWRSANGNTLVREFRQDIDRAGGDVGGPKPLDSLDHNGSYGPGGWPDPNVGFPTNLAAALAVLHKPATEQNANAQLTTITLAFEVGENLSVGTATPLQTATLYRVLATLPGVFDAGSVTDSAGRPGHAVGIVTSDSGSLVTGTEYFVLAPTTGQFLEDEVVDTPGPPPALHLPPGPTVEQYEVVLAAGQVSRPGVTKATP